MCDLPSSSRILLRSLRTELNPSGQIPLGQHGFIYLWIAQSNFESLMNSSWTSRGKTSIVKCKSLPPCCHALRDEWWPLKGPLGIDESSYWIFKLVLHEFVVQVGYPLA
jgi:hypothetical protein